MGFLSCIIVIIFLFIQLYTTVNGLNCITLNNSPIDAELTTPMEWIKESINVHNKYRKIHGAAPLKLNTTLCRSAQWTANANSIKGFMHTSKMSEGYHVNCGENLYTSTGKVRTLLPGDPIESWYSEEWDYDYETGKTKTINRPIGHFTQLVWKDSKEICIAYTKAGEKYYVAAHYFPRGNVRKRYVEKVGPQPLDSQRDQIRSPGGGNPWIEVLCKKYPLKSTGKRFKCHYKKFITSDNKKGLNLSKKDAGMVLDRLLQLDPISVLVEAPLTRIGIKL